MFFHINQLSGIGDPSTLEMLIMLRFNKDLWDAREVDIKMLDVPQSGIQLLMYSYVAL